MQIHVVRRGDTLHSISRTYNININQLIALNQLTNPGQLVVGQTLLIPQPETNTHLVKSGDTLFGIAKMHGTTVDALMADNIKTLVYMEDYIARGYSCPVCGHITLKLLEKCPYCENPLVNFNDIVDEIVESALNQGSEVLPVNENDKLKDAGKIGAVLRYKFETK